MQLLREILGTSRKGVKDRPKRRAARRIARMGPFLLASERVGIRRPSEADAEEFVALMQASARAASSVGGVSGDAGKVR